MDTRQPPTPSDLRANIESWIGRLTDLSWQRPAWPSIFASSGGESRRIGVGLNRRTILVEWSLIFIIVLAFCSGFLDLGTRRPLPGNEAEVFQSLDWTLVNSLSRYRQFPLWNPYLQAGLPFIADPFLHVYNPLVTLPVLIFGVLDGFKIALFLSFFAAGLGMWWLGVVLEVERPGRLWMALMYAFTGQEVARFFQGQYDFVLGFAWIPWVLAGLIATTRTRRKRYAALTAISLALLFFSGNVYYAYYMFFVIVLFLAIELLDLRSEKPFLRFDARKAGVLIVIGLLALGLVAIQLLPLVEFWPRIAKATNPELTDSQTIRQVFLDYISKEKWRADATKTLSPEEFYAYIGIWPFLALAMLPLAVWRREKKPLVFFSLLFVLVLLWIDVRDMPWQGFYARTAFLSQFRYPTRMLIYGACAIIVLAGLALDSLWSTLWGKTQFPTWRTFWQEPSLRFSSAGEVVRWTVLHLAVVLLSIFMIWSVRDVYATNKQHTRTRDPYEVSYEIMGWLRRFDPTEYYVGHPGGWHGAVFSNGLRYLDAWYGFIFVSQLEGLVNQRPVRARPHYVVLGNELTPEYPDPVVVQRFEAHTVYRLPHSLPFAFAVENRKLTKAAGNGELRREEVTPLPPFIPGPNGVEIIAEGRPDSSLVVLVNQYPGWQVTVDGRKQPLKNIGGYLATDLQPGIHKYVFSFKPTSFIVGFIISLLALLVTLGLLITDLEFKWQTVIARLRRLRDMGLGPVTPRPVASYAAGSETPTAVVEEAHAQAPAIPLIPPSLVVRGQQILINLPAWLSSLAFLEWTLFTLALLAYAVMRLRALDQFPIYFFTDEAIQPLLAEELITRRLRDPGGAWFPIYFEAAGQRWTPLLTVYIHILTTGLFGKSIFVTRATSAVISLLAAVAIGLVLKWIFKARYWWAGVLLLAITPAWFLHSRTAFETVAMASFYACFLLFYLLYRCQSPRYIFPAMLTGAAAFYAYSNGQGVMAAAGLFLLFSDIRYHLRHWRTVLPALLLGVVLAWPLISFRLNHPTSMQEHLRVIHSYWFQPIPPQEKLLRFVKTYGYGLSPQYWFFPNSQDLPRHRMAGYGHIRTELLPLVLIGVGLCLWRVRSSPHRTILLAALATPAGAALVGIGITRVLAFVVPATILAGLGLDWLLTRLPRRVPYDIVAMIVFLGLLVSSFSLLRHALVEGPLWFRDYGLYGMQYGAKQLFQEAIPQYLERDPDVQVMVSSTWANGTHRFVRFFLPSEQQHRVQIRTVDFYLFEKRDLTDKVVLVMTPQEYERARSSPKFKSVQVDRILPYPDGRPGFYFVRLTYADNVDAIFAAEREERRRPVEEQVELDGQTVRVRHSRFDMGQARDMFDGDRFTLARGLEANPLMIELIFPQPRVVTGLTADFATMDFTWTIELYEEGAEAPVTYTETYRGLPSDPHVELNFDRGPHKVSKIRIQIKNLKAGDVAKIHVRELRLR